MRILVYFMLVTALLVTAVQANPTAQQFYQQGNEAMQKGLPEEAVKAYESALATGYVSAELYYNLGNANFRLERLGKAILCYQRARLLSPADPDIQFNLELAQLRVVDKVVTPAPFFAARVWSGIKNALGPGQWGVMALVLFNLLIAAVIIRLLVSQAGLRAAAGYLFVPLLVLFMVAGLFFWVSAGDAKNIRYGIIMPHKVSILSSPASDATQVFDLHEGTQVRVGERSGAWIKVSLPDGKVGWMPVDGVEEI